MAFSSAQITSKQHGRARYSRPNPRDVRGVIVHHMAGYFDAGLRQGLVGDYVANFYIGNGQCVEVIPAEQMGYHAANMHYNSYYVGIEHANISLAPNWGVANDTLERSAKLMADLSRYYGWGKLVHGKNVFMHREVSQLGTACPGPYLSARLDYLISRANHYLAGGGRVDNSYGNNKVKKDGSNLPIDYNLRVGQFKTRVNVNALNIRKAPSTSSAVVGVIRDKGQYVIDAQRGAWGHIPGRGWIYMWKNYCTPVSRGPNPGYKRPKFKPYKIRVTANALNVRKAPNLGSPVVGLIHYNEIYTIVEKRGQWGKLKSGAGWIHLDYTKIFR